MRTPHTAPATSTPIEARVEQGFRLEVLRYGPANGFRPEPVDLRIVPTPREAVRAIRAQLRASHVLGLPPRETARALRWSEHGGWLPALAALHRGEPCGFVLLLRRGRHLEWTVRPLHYLSLAPALR
ncbi:MULTISPECIES: hypothetical protein [unclassified Streptomyces]|uniref:hypothetical protein n=1 Tax=unclassified Streptomyces TaxID=2593676 RepID=UPI003246DBB5